MFMNRFAGKCNNRNCNAKVAANEGFTQKIDNRYVVWCKTCCPERIGAAPVQNQIRVLTSDCKIIMPYEVANLPLVKSLPGARWNANEKCWSVSTEPADRRRILEVADKIGLEVAPTLRVTEICDQAKMAQEAGLYAFQVEGVDWLSQKRKALLGDEMGLGKSAMSLMIIPKGGAAMVICRAGLKYNWKNECQKWRKDLTPVVLDGRNNFRWPKSGELVIINNDILPDEFNKRPNKGRTESNDTYFARLQAWRDELKANNPDAANTQLIIDEAHDYKNRKAARTRKVKEIGMMTAKTTALTGSPLTNRPDDLFGVLDTVGVAKEVFGSFDRFQSLFNAVHNGYGIEYGKPNPIVPELLRRVMLRRRRSEVLKQIPAKTYTPLVVGNTSSRLTAKLDEMWKGWEGFILNAGSLPPFEQFASIRADLAESRIEAMIDYVENAEEQECPLLVFSAHLAPLDALIGRDGWAIITGDVKPERRQQIVDDFQAGRLKGVGISIRAGGVGLTLTRAHKALFVDLDWTPASNWQAEDRICRIGQTANTVEIIRMVSDHPLDIHVQNMLVDKIDTINRSIDQSIQGEVNQGRSVNADPQGETEEEFQARMQRVAQMEANNAAEEQRKAKEYAKSRVSGIHARESARMSRQMLPLTPERSEQVRQAFSFMLNVCDGAVQRDGQGFNKPDAAVAHCLLTAGLDTTEELEAGFMILSRYHRQLSERYPTLFRNAA